MTHLCNQCHTLAMFIINFLDGVTDENVQTEQNASARGAHRNQTNNAVEAARKSDTVHKLAENPLPYIYRLPCSKTAHWGAHSQLRPQDTIFQKRISKTYSD